MAGDLVGIMIRAGDNVAFSAAVGRRCGHDKRTGDARGRVVSVAGRVAEVDFEGTFTREDGERVRWVPVANLVRVRADGLVFDL